MPAHLPPVAALALAAATIAQDGRLTVSALFEEGVLAAEPPPAVRWLPDGTGYLTLEAVDAGQQIVRHALPGGERQVLLPAARLVPAGAAAPLPVADFALSPDGRRALVFTNTRRVWRAHTRGDYWVVGLAGEEPPRRLGGKAPAASLMFAKFSPDGAAVAFVRDNDLWLEDLDGGGGVRRLTHTGSRTVINGTFDWVYEEEFFLRDGFRWSPDGRRIAFWQLDTAGVGEFPLVDNLAGPYARVVPIPYPKAGTTNSACRVGVVDRAGGEPTWAQLAGDPRENYVARMEWAGNSDELVVQQLDRRQQENRVQLVDAATGAVRTLLADRDDAWVEVVDDLVWLAGGARFTWISERGGWRQLWLGRRDGGEPVLATPEGWDVVDVLHVDPAGKGAYVLASPTEPVRRYLYWLGFDGPVAARLTPAAAGVNEYDVAPDGRHALWTHSSFREPPVVQLVALPEHRVLATVADNRALRARLDGIARGASEFFRVDAAGIELDGWVVYPPGFDPARRWPVLFHVYGEPWKQTVLDQWGVAFQGWHWLLAQQGWVVASVDNRGTPAPRGRAWRKCVYQRIGTLAAAEQAAACRALAARWSWLDRDRVGIWGWSGGGSMTLNCMFRHPGLYRAGIAVAPVSDLRLYDTIYQERYMGLPAEAEAAYRESSPLTHASALRADLLLVHGTGDDNVHYQNLEVLVDELVRHGRPFAMMAYPNRTHAIAEGEGTRVHHFELMTRFLHEKLPAGGR